MGMQYFHPDNMSSAEKLKIELSKVREEFKMSESDCGSARVQGKELLMLDTYDYALVISSQENILGYLLQDKQIIIFVS